MADVSKVKLPNGTIVNVKDETARANIKTYTLTQDSSDGHKITLTPSSGTGQTITIPDNNTTYTFDTGANNGQIKVTPSGGTAQNVSVKGLGTAAYKAITDTYSSTGTDATSGKAVAAALGTLDGTVSGSAGASKTLTAFSQTDGKVSATFGNISITKSQVSDFPTLGTAAAKNFTTSVTSGSADLVTSGAVYTAIDNLPEPMVFKGTLGTGGTITTLPTAAASNEGYTYKVITAGTYASQAAKVGDVFVSTLPEGSSVYTWELIPAGDTDSDTWRAIKVNGTQLLGSAISTGAVNFKNGSNVTISGSGNDITIAATDNNTTYTFANGTNGFTVTPAGGTAQTVTVTPSITNNVTGSGTSGYIAKFNGANTITNAVALGSDTTKYLRNDGTWQVPSYPTVNNATLTIQKNGTNVQTFTANQGTNATANITVPTKTSELTNNSNFVTSDNATPYEAKLRWGGKNFSSSYGCIDAAMVPELGANRLAFIRASAITIEYSRDSGSTWTDAGISDSAKVDLFDGVGTSTIFVGNATSSSPATAQYQTRITLNTGLGNVYTTLNKFVLYVTTNNSQNCTCKITAAKEATPNTYEDITSDIPISGWSDYNVINISGLTTYGNTASTQYGRVRFTFKVGNTATSQYYGLQIRKIFGFGGVGWEVPSAMARDGHLYTYDSSQNANFPSQITASQFNGALNGNASTATLSNTVNGAYTGSGGQQGPGYFGTNRAGFLMSNSTVAGDSHYKNWLYMDNYAGSDVGGATAFGIDRTEPRAFIMQSDANRTSWNNTAALGVFTSTPTSGQVVTTDGTTGGIKSSGYTIAKSVPSNAAFTDTTYTFANGTNGFTVTPSGGTAQTVTVTPSITNNITGSGTNGYIAKFNGANTITNGPAFGSTTTTYLNNAGSWATPPDTKNTAGSTDTSSKIFLVGATSQAANPQTYSDNEVYATSGVLTTKSVQVGGGSATLQYNATTQAIDFVFA